MSDGAKEMQNDARVYELGYLLVPTIAGEEVPVHYGNMKELVRSFGGDIISDDMPKFLNLAYSMRKVTSNLRSKYSSAYFGWIKFEMDAKKVTEMKEKLDLDPNLIRFLIIKTVRESTLAVKRYTRPEGMYRPRRERKDTDTPAQPINKEEIDKEIEALVAN